MEKIRITDSFINNFLKPIENISHKALFTIKDDKISTVVVAPETSIILALESDIEANFDEKRIAVADVRKLKSHLSQATDLEDNDELEIDGNKLKYSSDKWRFVLHLLDESILNSPPFSKDKIKSFDTKKSFILKADVIKQLVKLKAANKEASKVYFKFLDSGVYADVTDYTISNTDISGVKVSDKYQGDIDTRGCPVIFDIIKLISGYKNLPFKVKYNGNIFLFQSIIDGVSITYIISENTN